jgi:hypothetical protein
MNDYMLKNPIIIKMEISATIQRMRKVKNKLIKNKREIPALLCSHE